MKPLLNPIKSSSGVGKARILSLNQSKQISSVFISVHREDALLITVDEKSQIQALDRTQPMLSLRPGKAKRQDPHLRQGMAQLGTETTFLLLNCVLPSIFHSLCLWASPSQFPKNM